MLAVALCLSAVAAFYSIVGLTAIFAASVIPVVIMGSILEVAKLVITVWLHEYWPKVKLGMKMYLVPAVVILMFITSMGIFGFLSKAHIEQVGVGQENAAQLQRIETEIKRQTEIVGKAEERAKTLETSGTGADANVNSQIKTEQGRIDSALARVQPAIDEQQKIIDGQTKLYSDQVAKIDEQLTQLQKFIDATEVDKAQALVGVKVDGDWGPGTARAVTTWKAARAQERAAAVAKLEEANRDLTIRAARDEILRIRKTVETQVAESNRLIDRLRNQLGKGDTASVEALVNEQQERIKVANAEIETLTQKKYALEAEYRKLEVEVGPIKYIAELIYGESTDTNLLEKAVRWVIILIVAVFDPLAVMMLLAATESMNWVRRVLPKIPEPEIVPEPPRKPDTKPDPEPELKPVVEEPKSPRDWNTFFKPEERKLPEIEPMPDLYREGLPAIIDNDLAQKKTELDDETELTHGEKEARRQWKSENPGQTIKEQKKLLEEGVIDHLPWDEALAIEADNAVKFGTALPSDAYKGQLYLHVGYLPSKLFKYNGNKWIEVDKQLTDRYAFNEAYIDYLISKISSGEYDTDLLSDAERISIEQRITPKG